ncbi:MAG: MBL fold metallo-hydrolase [Acetivibrionales bacterium]|jgi:hydroxyacylglutathione hydrolase
MKVQVGYIVNSVYSSRTYYLYVSGCPDVWLVDCGDTDLLVRELESLKEAGFSIKGVLLTHAHYDHIYGLPRLVELFPEVRIYTNEIGRKMLGSDKLNMSKYHEDPIVVGSEHVALCEDGSRIEMFNGIEAKVHFTPGHNPSCLTYEVGDYLFTGDSYIPGIKVVTNLPGGNKELAAQSLERILELAEGKVLCPGHVVEGL